MAYREIAGLRLGRNTLEPIRETEIRSWVDKGPYGPVEDWKGWIEVDVLPRCILSDELKLDVAKRLATEALPHSFEVDHDGWKIERPNQFVIRLRPYHWTESRGLGFEVVR